MSNTLVSYVWLTETRATHVAETRRRRGRSIGRDDVQDAVLSMTIRATSSKFCTWFALPACGRRTKRGPFSAQTAMAVEVYDASAVIALKFSDADGARTAARLGNGNLIAPSALSYKFVSVSLRIIRTQQAEARLTVIGAAAFVPLDCWCRHEIEPF